MRIHTPYHHQGSIRMTSESSIHNPNSQRAKQERAKKLQNNRYTPRAQSKTLDAIPIEQCLNCPLKKCDVNIRGECTVTKMKQNPTPPHP